MRINGNQAEKHLELDRAIHMFEILHNRKPANSNVGFRLANLYEITRQYEKAKDLYKKLYELSPDKNQLALYSFGKMAMACGNYRLARRGFEKFYNEFQANDKNKYLRKQADLFRDYISFLIDSTNHSQNISEIQTDMLQDYSTSHFSKLVFDPYGMKAQTKHQIPGMDSIHSTAFYPNIPSESQHSIPGEKIYYSSCFLEKKRPLHCLIYKTTFDSAGMNWEKPQKLPPPVNSEKYLAIHPTMGVDIRTNQPVLYFVSDRPGGKGGLDIWYSRYDERKKQFREPKNAGSKINSPEDEISPFYDDSTKTIYYSSSGFPGYGAFDVFKSHGSLRNWTEPENLGSTINSSVDDYFFARQGNSDNFCLASNRNTWNDMEIPGDEWFVYRPLESAYQRISIKFHEVENKKYKHEKLIMAFDTLMVKTESSFNIEIYLLSDLQDSVLITSEQVHLSKAYPYKLQKGKKYKIVSSNNSGSTFFIQVPETIQDSMLHYVMPVSPGTSITLKKTIFHELNQTSLTEELTESLDSSVIELLKIYPDANLAIHSYTDQTGSNQMNKRLSLRRAKNVVGYISDQHADRKRITYHGHGEKNPVMAEKNDDGTVNATARSMNRRTEIIITITL